MGDRTRTLTAGEQQEVKVVFSVKGVITQSLIIIMIWDTSSFMPAVKTFSVIQAQASILKPTSHLVESILQIGSQGHSVPVIEGPISNPEDKLKPKCYILSTCLHRG